jgi:hypothetical protein
MQYVFRFSGEINPKSSPQQVAHNLAKLFQVTTAEVMPLLNGRACFERRDIAKITAEAYVDEFARAGAIGYLEKIDDVKQNVYASDSVLASSVRTNSAVAAESIQNGNLYSGRPERRVIRDDKKEIGETPRLSARVKQAARAALWLKYAGIGIVSVTIADGYLQDALIIDQWGMDIGYWPYILAHIPLIYGCSLLARVKGYGASLGMLGALSLLGLSLLLLMRDKHNRHQQRAFKIIPFSIFSAFLSIYWYSNLSDSLAEQEAYTLTSQSLYLGRNEYTSSLQGGLEIYKAEQVEMRDYLLETIQLIDQGDLRPNVVEQISEQMFFEFSRYVIWRKYQQFSHLVAGKRLPKGLSDGFNEKDQALFNRILVVGITGSSHARLRSVRDSWFIAPSTYEQRPSEAEKFGSSLEALRVAAINAMIIKQRNAQREARQAGPDVAEPLTLLAEDLAGFAYPGISVKYNGAAIEYTWQAGPYADKTLALGIYTKISVNRSGKKNYSPQLIVLSHQFPAKYISKFFAVFDGYGY